jgi:RsiW-degrading membrane proteinase PrsW (M82 family)
MTIKNRQNIKHESKPSALPVWSFTIGMLVALFAVYYAFEVFFQSISFSENRYLGVIGGFAIVFSVIGAFLGLKGFKSSAKRKTTAGIILCLLAFASLIYIDLHFVPSGSLF